MTGTVTNMLLYTCFKAIHNQRLRREVDCRLADLMPLTPGPLSRQGQVICESERSCQPPSPALPPLTQGKGARRFTTGPQIPSLRQRGGDLGEGSVYRIEYLPYQDIVTPQG